MDAMFSLIWILAIGWLLVTLINSWHLRSVERDWENLLHEHGAPSREQMRRPQGTIVEARQ
jgi:hypothetical protein